MARQSSIVNAAVYNERSWYQENALDDLGDELASILEDDDRALTLLYHATDRILGTGWVDASRMIDFPLSNRLFGSCDYPRNPFSESASGTGTIKTSDARQYFSMDHNAIRCGLESTPTTQFKLTATRCGVPVPFEEGIELYVVGTGYGVHKLSLFDVASTEAGTWYGFDKEGDGTYVVQVPNVFLADTGNPTASQTPPVVLACKEGEYSNCTVTPLDENQRAAYVELPGSKRCTHNYLLAADAGWGAVPEDEFDFVGLPDPDPDDQEEGMGYEITLPDWLKLEPASGTLDPGQHFSEIIDVDAAQAFCDEAVEKEGKIVVQTHNPELKFEVPARLMCAELELRFEPTDYNQGLLSVEPEKRCGRITGTATVRGADHLKEMYAYDVYDTDGNYVETRYNEPFIDYVVEHANYTSLRFPWTGEEDTHRPDNAHDWDWSSYPEIPFFSWASSCVFDVGEHQVNTYYLVHPRRLTGNQRIERRASSAGAPAAYTVHDNRFPGAVYDGARFCESDSQGGETCTEANARVGFSTAGYVDVLLSMDFGEWRFGFHPFAQTFDEAVTLIDGEGSTLADDVLNLPEIIARDRIRYCIPRRTNAFRKSDESTFDVDGVPPVFWTQNIELHKTDTGVWYPVVVEGVASWHCYEPWDETGESVESIARALRYGTPEPLGRLELNAPSGTDSLRGFKLFIDESTREER